MNLKRAIILSLILSLFLLLVIMIALYIIQRNRVSRAYNERYTFGTLDNVPANREIPGVKITSNEIRYVGGMNPLFKEWLIITEVQQYENITGSEEKLKYITLVELDNPIKGSRRISVDIQEGNTPNEQIFESYKNNELKFILGDYNFIQERMADY